MSVNVLLITFSFPPAGGVGVLRALSLAKYLPENDIRVDVLTARNAPSVGKDLSLLAQVPAEVTVHRTWTLDLPFALRKAVKKLVSGRKPVASAASPAPHNAQPTAGNPLKRLIGNLLLPDPQVGWLPFAFPAARRIIRQRHIDVVLITVPPFSTLMLTSKLRRAFPALPIVIDFRDEWLSTTINLVSFNNNARARAIAHATEADAVRDASAVVLVTEAARDELRARYPQHDPTTFHYLPNGFETRNVTSATSPTTRTNDTVVLTYLGTVYGSTNPETLVEAVLGLPPELRTRLKLRFIGHIESPALRAALLTLGDTVELQGFVPQAEALRAIDDTDYLLLLTHDRINVSAKFYDYLSGAKPILAALNPAGDVRKLLDETHSGRWADIADPASIRALLASVLEAGQASAPPTPNPPPNATRIATYHRRAIAQRYAALLKSLLPNR